MSMRRLAFILFIAIVIGSGVSPPALANFEGTEQAVSFPTDWEHHNAVHWLGIGAASRTVGYKFMLTEEKTLTHLGIWVYQVSGDTLPLRDRPIGVWDSQGNLVASVVLPAGGGTPDNSGSPPLHPFIYQPLQQYVVLGPGDYVIGAHYPDNDNSPGLGFAFTYDVVNPNEPFVDTGAILQADGFIYGGTMRSDTETFSMPTISIDIGGSIAGGNRPNGYFGPNMRFLVPEPATAAILMIAGVCTFLHRRQV